MMNATKWQETRNKTKNTDRCAERCKAGPVTATWINQRHRWYRLSGDTSDPKRIENRWNRLGAKRGQACLPGLTRDTENPAKTSVIRCNDGMLTYVVSEQLTLDNCLQ
jgi:hypothetical protein